MKKRKPHPEEKTRPQNRINEQVEQKCQSYICMFREDTKGMEILFA
jgi:hypothetical protein